MDKPYKPGMKLRPGESASFTLPLSPDLEELVERSIVQVTYANDEPRYMGDGHWASMLTIYVDGKPYKEYELTWVWRPPTWWEQLMEKVSWWRK